MNKRKTSSDYRKELKSLRNDMKSLENHVIERLWEMCHNFPGAVILMSETKEKLAEELTRSEIENMSIEVALSYLDRIERYSETLQKTKQLVIE